MWTTSSRSLKSSANVAAGRIGEGMSNTNVDILTKQSTLPLSDFEGMEVKKMPREELEDKIKEIEARISWLEDDIAEQESIIEDAEFEKDSLNEELRDAEQELADAQQELDDLEDEEDGE